MQELVSNSPTQFSKEADVTNYVPHYEELKTRSNKLSSKINKVEEPPSDTLSSHTAQEGFDDTCNINHVSFALKSTSICNFPQNTIPDDDLSINQTETTPHSSIANDSHKRILSMVAHCKILADDIDANVIIRKETNYSKLAKNSFNDLVSNMVDDDIEVKCMSEDSVKCLSDGVSIVLDDPGREEKKTENDVQNIEVVKQTDVEDGSNHGDGNPGVGSNYGDDLTPEYLKQYWIFLMKTS